MCAHAHIYDYMIHISHLSNRENKAHGEQNLFRNTKKMVMRQGIDTALFCPSSTNTDTIKGNIIFLQIHLFLKEEISISEEPCSSYLPLKYLPCLPNAQRIWCPQSGIQVLTCCLQSPSMPSQVEKNRDHHCQTHLPIIHSCVAFLSTELHLILPPSVSAHY